MVGVSGSRGWAYAGVLSAAFLVPVMHLAAVDLEGKTASETAYLGHVDDRYLSVALAGGFGLILTALLVVYLAGLRQIAVIRRPLLADASIAIGGLAVMGLAVGFASSVIAAYGAHENYPFAPVRSLGILAENFPVVLMPGLAGPAVLISVLALRDRVLPRLLGYVSAFFAVVLAVLGVVLPGVSAIPALAWLLLSSLALSMTPDRSAAVTDEKSSR